MTPLNQSQQRSLKKILSFLEDELRDLARFKNLSYATYSTSRDTRRNVERLAENLVNASIDIAKILVAGESLQMPDTYREIFQSLEQLEWIDNELSSSLQAFTRLRNTLAHEYLDIRWKQLQKLLREGEHVFSQFTRVARAHLERSPSRRLQRRHEE